MPDKKSRRFRSLVVATAIALVTVAAGCATYSPAPFPPPDEDLAPMATADGVRFVRTPDEFFSHSPGWTLEARYVEIDGLRRAYVDVGPRDSEEAILLLHGQPSPSYLYRTMIPVLVDAGYRVIAMDHLGMSRSDKPIDLYYDTYQRQVDRLYAIIRELELGNITAFVQDWGSLIGLNVIGNHPELFARHSESFRPSLILEAMTCFPLTDEVRAAYDAPFPARIAMGGPRSFPGPANQLGGATASAWEGPRAYTKPFPTIRAANDPGNLGRRETQRLLTEQTPGAAGPAHVRLPEASHFLQDDQGEQIARLMIEFIQSNPLEQ